MMHRQISFEKLTFTALAATLVFSLLLQQLISLGYTQVTASGTIIIRSVAPVRLARRMATNSAYHV